MAAIVVAVKQAPEDVEKLVVDLQVFHPQSGAFLVYKVPYSETRDTGVDNCWFWPPENEWQKEEQARKDKVESEIRAARMANKKSKVEEDRDYAGR